MHEIIFIIIQLFICSIGCLWAGYTVGFAKGKKKATSNFVNLHKKLGGTTDIMERIMRE